MTIFTFRGIPIRLHSSFILLSCIVLLMELWSGGLAAVGSVAFLGAVLFGSVLLHELGHAMVGRLYGIPTRDITLYPFGGIAAMQVEPRRPRVELLVALAGPAVNFVLAGVGAVLLGSGFPGAAAVVMINLVMGLFNLVPAFPMDGGRVLRALWSPRLGPWAATRRALRVSRVFAALFVVAGLFFNPSLLLVGVFLFFVTAAERRRLAQWAARMPHWIERAGAAIPMRIQRSFEHPVS